MMMFSRKSFVDRATRKFKKLPLSCLSMAPMSVCAADGNRVSMTPGTVDSTAGARLKAALLDHFDSLRATMFLPDQSLLVTRKEGVSWLLELAWQSSGEDSAAAEIVPSVVRRTSVTGLPDIRAVEHWHHEPRLVMLLEGMAAGIWSLGHRNPLDVEKRASQTLH